MTLLGHPQELLVQGEDLALKLLYLTLSRGQLLLQGLVCLSLGLGLEMLILALQFGALHHELRDALLGGVELLLCASSSVLGCDGSSLGLGELLLHLSRHGRLENLVSLKQVLLIGP